MTAKTCRLMTPVLVTGLMLSGTVGCSPQSASSEGEKPAVATASNSTDLTIFECVPQEGGWATIAKRGNAVSVAPLLTWNSTEFGPEYTPEQRCQMVSTKLTNAVKANGGKLGNLVLTAGKVKKKEKDTEIEYTVVCLPSQAQSKCNLDNILFTLNKENAKNPSAVLAKITNFSQGKATDSSVTEKGGPESIVLETLVNRLLPKDSGF